MTTQVDSSDDCVCKSCPFHIDDSDFTSSNPPKDCLPCGGLLFMSKNLKKLGFMNRISDWGTCLRWENQPMFVFPLAPPSIFHWYLRG